MYRFKNCLLVRVVLTLLCILALLQNEASSASTSSTKVVAQAKALIDDDRIEPALAILNRLISLEPRNAWALSERSRAFRKTGQFEKADADANRAVAIAPQSAIVRANRALLYGDAKQYQLAIKECDKAISQDPLFVKGYTARVNILIRMGKCDEAIPDCSKAISLAPNSPDNYLLRGSAFRQKERVQLAESDFKKALELSIKSPSYSPLLRGSIYFYLNRFRETIIECNYILELNPHYTDALYLRASAFSRLGRFQNEIDDLTEALKLTPQDCDLYELRAVAEYKMFQHSAVIRDCKKAIALSSHTDLRPLLAKTYDEIGQQKDPEQISSELPGQSKAASGADTNQKKNIEVNFKSQNAVIDFTYEPGGHLTVPVGLDGKTLQVTLDTGSAMTSIKKAAMQNLDRHPNFDRSFIRADGRRETAGQILVNDFSLDTAQFKNVQVDVADWVAEKEASSGLLGGDVLKTCVVKIDYANKKIVLTKTCDSIFSQDAIIVPLIIRDNCPYCFVRVDDQFDRPAVLDTGAPLCLAADALLEPVLPKNMKFGDTATGPWLGDISSETIRLKKIGFENYGFTSPLCKVFQASKLPRVAGQILIGNDFLSQFKTVTFDYPNRRAIFEPAANAAESPWRARQEALFSLQQEDYSSVIKYLNQFLAAEPIAGREYLCIRGRAYMNLKEYKKAMDDFDYFLRESPNDPHALVERAYVHDKLNEFEEAVEDDTAAIKSDPRYRYAYEHRAWMYELLGKKSTL